MYIQIHIRRDSRSGSQNCGKKTKIIIHHFLEIVQYICNTSFLYQNLMGNPKNKRKYKFPSIFTDTQVFFYDHVQI